MAATGHLSWWVENMINENTKEHNEKAIFETWLHKEWKRSFEDYKTEVMRKANLEMKNSFVRNNPIVAAQTVKNSFDIIKSFGKPKDL